MAQKTTNPIPDALRAAAQKAGSLEALRTKLKMSGGLFYDLLKGERPKKIATVERLKKHGVLSEDARVI